MDTNKTPIYDMSDNPTGCCPRFKAEGWDEQRLHFQGKLFVRAETMHFLHIPINMGNVFAKTSEAIEKADAMEEDQFVVLSNELSPWKSEHYFSVSKEVPGQKMVQLTGEYLTKVFEGPYKEVPHWHQQMKQYVRGMGKETKKVYFFYTTCPSCAKYYGKNYVVGFGEVV